MEKNDLSILFDEHFASNPTLARKSLKDQAVELLRNHIVGGSIPPGTKLVERKVAGLLGISASPVRPQIGLILHEALPPMP